MDNFLLQAVATGMAARLDGTHVESVQETPGGALLLAFADPSRERRAAVIAEAAPGRERIHLASGFVPTLRSVPGGFTAVVASRLAGARLVAVEKDLAERVVTFRFADGSRLIAEMIGRASNLLFVAPDGAVAGFARRLRSTHRRPGIGEAYVPPPRGRLKPSSQAPIRGGHGSSGERPDLFTIPGDELRRIVGAAAADDDRLAPNLVRRLFGMSKIVADDLERLHERGGDAPGELVARRDAMLAGRYEPVVCSPAPLADMALDSMPAASMFFALPLSPGAPPEGAVITRFDDANAAADAYYGAMVRVRAFVRRRDGLATILRKELSRAERLSAHLEKDRRSLPAPGEARRQAEALLAGMASAERAGRTVEVPDPYDESGITTIRFAVDPALSLQANAEALFRRDRKAGRGREAIAGRVLKNTTRRESLGTLEGRIERARDADALHDIEEAMRPLGLVLEPERPLSRRSRRRGGGVPDAAPRLAGIRIYKSSEGFEILVGKTGRENDRLTFRIASPEDFWLHAVGSPGAHVVVRNPRRVDELPRRTLLEAARLAAHFSRQATSGRVEVHVTRRKHVRKARGAPPGTVTVKRFKALAVEPGDPFGGQNGP